MLLVSISGEVELLSVSPKRIFPLLQSDQLPINSPPVGFRFGSNVCSRNSAKARFRYSYPVIKYNFTTPT